MSALHELDVLFEPDVNVVVLMRPLGPELEDSARASCATLAHRTLLFAVEPNARGEAELAAQLSFAPALARDVQRWILLFSDLTEATSVGVRLAVLTAAMCPRLHVDRTGLRAVVTYQGDGTEFVDHASFAPSSPLPAEPARIERATAGDLVLLKGEAWPGNTGRGAVHRSPPASADAPRLVLTLDAL